MKNDLSNEEQLCIAADMYFRLREERVAEKAGNTLLIPVYYSESAARFSRFFTCFDQLIILRR